MASKVELTGANAVMGDKDLHERQKKSIVSRLTMPLMKQVAASESLRCLLLR